jgi:hypothetical protein
MANQFRGYMISCGRRGILLMAIITCLAGFLPRALAQSMQVSSRTTVRLSPPEEKELRRREDSLKVFADRIVNGEKAEDRFRADSQFIRSLVRALKLPNSFYYPFDSLETISSLYSPDSTFRILTWQFKKDDLLYLQEGAIQMNEPDGSLKLFPLFDASMFTSRPLDSVRTRKNWIGAIYYKIILKTYQDRKFYTLIGFDDYSQTSNKKWMEVLTFGPGGEPQFGGPYFSFRDDSVHRPTQYRFCIEYKKEAATRFNYDPEMDMVLYDQLVPEGDEPQKKDTYIPDGDFEGFKWQNGQWLHVQRDILNTLKLKDGQFPMSAKMLDDQGNIDEQKLLDQSEKNQQKKKDGKPAPAPVKPPKKSGTP